MTRCLIGQKNETKYVEVVPTDSNPLCNINAGSNKNFKQEIFDVNPVNVIDCYGDTMLNKNSDELSFAIAVEVEKPNTSANLETDSGSAGSLDAKHSENKLQRLITSENLETDSRGTQSLNQVNSEYKVIGPDTLKNLNVFSTCTMSQAYSNSRTRLGKIVLPPHAEYRIKCKMK